MTISKAFMLAGIKNLLIRNYHIDIDKIDLEAEIDETLSFGENWQHIKEKVSWPS